MYMSYMYVVEIFKFSLMLTNKNRKKMLIIVNIKEIFLNVYNFVNIKGC